eukprot:2774090-Pyramimonas_sp.AAC.1
MGTSRPPRARSGQRVEIPGLRSQHVLGSLALRPLASPSPKTASLLRGLHLGGHAPYRRTSDEGFKDSGRYYRMLKHTTRI